MHKNQDNTFEVIKLDQRSPEWKEWRRGKIGGSQIAGLMGINPYQTILQTWEEIQLGKEKDLTEPMERGIRLESKALAYVNKQLTGKSQPFSPITIQHLRYPELIASLDGWNGMNGVEIKAPGKKNHTIALSGKIPDLNIPQMQHYMWMTGRPHWWFCSYQEREEDSVILICQRDDEFITRMVQAELAFAASLADYRPPEPSQADWAEDGDPERIVKAFRYQELCRLADEIEQEREEIRNSLISGAGHPRMKCGDLKIQKVVSRGHIDYKAIPEIQSLDLEKYRGKPRESWRIT